MKQSALLQIFPHSAGIDLGSEKIFIGIGNKEVTSYDTFTDSYLEAIAYLKENGVTTVAMEATGVYWIAFYDLLEEAGIDVYLVSGRDVKNVPGRKSDVADCQWLQQLHSYGLLRRCFIPDDVIRQLRTYTRLRQDHICLSAQHIQHMQKSLDLMNIKLHNVISQINGVSGIRILKAILAGNHNPVSLAELCENSILKMKKELVIASLKGSYRQEHLFSLRQALDGYEFYQKQIRDCDNQIKQLLETINKDKPTPQNPTHARHVRHNDIQIDNLHEHLLKLTGGNDASQITGLSDKLFLELIGETGTDLTKWKTEKHFTCWLGLSPSKHQSGKSNKKKRRRCKTKAGQIFRQAAFSIANSKYSALSSFYHRMSARKGSFIANKATARKIAVLYYRVLTKGIEFVEQGLIAYQQKFKEQQIKRVQKQAERLGLKLMPVTI